MRIDTHSGHALRLVEHVILQAPNGPVTTLRQLPADITRVRGCINWIWGGSSRCFVRFDLQCTLVSVD